VIRIFLLCFFTVLAFGSLIGEWRLDEKSGNVTLDASGASNHGSFIGSIGWSNGSNPVNLDEDMLRFQSNGYVYVADSPSLNPTTELTIEAQVMRPGSVFTPPSGTIVSKGQNGNQYALRLTLLGTISFTIGNAQFNSFNYIFRANTWYHIIAVFSQSQLRVLVDNGTGLVEAGTSVGFSSPIPASSGYGLGIGGNPNSTQQYFNGFIYNVKIYDNSIVPPAPKPSLPDYAQPFTDIPLLGHWDLNNGQGDLAYDVSGNNNHGVKNQGVNWTTGLIYGAALFEETVPGSIIVSNVSLFNPTDVLVLEAFVSHTLETLNGAIISKGNQYSLSINNGDVRFQVGSNTLTSAFNFVSFGNWYHIRAMYNSTKMNIWVDGNLLPDTINNPASYNATAANLTFGVTGTNNNPFDGKMDEIRIYGSGNVNPVTDTNLFTLGTTYGRPSVVTQQGHNSQISIYSSVFCLLYVFMLLFI